MRDDLPANDPRTIWQNQPTEPSSITSEQIRWKTRKLRAKTLRERLRNIVMPLLVIGFSGLAIAQARDAVQRTIYAFAIAWALLGQFILHRRIWRATLPGDSALSTGLEFYRREIERRRYLFHHVLQRCALVLAIGAFILPIIKSAIGNRVPFRNAMPFMALLVMWMAAFVVVRVRGQRELQREIDELNVIERENRQ